MRALVTGAAGFIGSKVAALLADGGHDVVGVDNMGHAYDPRLKQWRVEHVLGKRPNLRFEQLDITDATATTKLVIETRPDVIYNLAARAGVRQSVADPWGYLDVNVRGALNLLEAARRADVGTVLLASTSSLYGKDNPRPFREDAPTDNPLSPYAASKKGAEAITASYAHLYGLCAPVVRYFTVYGPAGRPDMSVFRFVRWIREGDPVVLHGDGSQERDFTFVDDIARGTIAAASRLRGFRIVNLGGDAPVSMLALINRIEDCLGRRATIVRKPALATDVPATWADISTARTQLGWAPEVGLSEGIARTARWYEENRSWASQIELGGFE